MSKLHTLVPIRQIILNAFPDSESRANGWVVSKLGEDLEMRVNTNEAVPEISVSFQSIIPSRELNKFKAVEQELTRMNWKNARFQVIALFSTLTFSANVRYPMNLSAREFPDFVKDLAAMLVSAPWPTASWSAEKNLVDLGISSVLPKTPESTQSVRPDYEFESLDITLNTRTLPEILPCHALFYGFSINAWDVQSQSGETLSVGDLEAMYLKFTATTQSAVLEQMDHLPADARDLFIELADELYPPDEAEVPGLRNLLYFDAFGIHELAVYSMMDVLALMEGVPLLTKPSDIVAVRIPEKLPEHSRDTLKLNLGLLGFKPVSRDLANVWMLEALEIPELNGRPEDALSTLLKRLKK